MYECKVNATIFMQTYIYNYNFNIVDHFPVIFALYTYRLYQYYGYNNHLYNHTFKNNMLTYIFRFI